MDTQQVTRMRIDGRQLEYRDRGTGESVVFIHGAVPSLLFAPLDDEPALKAYRLVTYNRPGFGQSERVDTISVREQAILCRTLMRHLEIDRAHVVSHSAGGLIGLQLVQDFPEAVHSLTLLEPALPWIAFAAPEMQAAVEKTVPLYQAGDKAGALAAFILGACRPDAGDALLAAFGPSAFAEGIASLDTLMQVEFPALQAWSMTKEDARRISQPVLSIVGANSYSYFRDIQACLQDWLPQTETHELANSDHLMPVRNPRDLAQALAGFFRRHPLPQAAALPQESITR